jgi:hypothetical protein
VPGSDVEAKVIRLFDGCPHGDVTSDAPAVPAGSRVPYSGAYKLRGRWLSASYGPLRNAAWAARNARVASNQNPLALRLVLAEAENLIGAGEQLGDVLEAFAELLMRP